MRLCQVVAVLLTLLATSGCTHSQLRWNTTHQAHTLTDIFEQQVLDNLAMFVCNPNGLPSFAYPNQGASDVTDSGSMGEDMRWTRPASKIRDLILTEHLFKVSGSRNMKEAWTLTPVYDVRRLELMRCAYQQALSCSGHCTLGGGCPDCDKLQRNFYLGDPNGRYNAADSTRPDHLSTFTIARGRTTPACFTCKPWLCCSDSPPVFKKDCRCTKVGRHCGTYVWVNSEGLDEFAKLTMVILDYAFTPQAQAPSSARKTKEVIVFLDKNGKAVDKWEDRAIEVKTTMDVGAAIPVNSPIDTLRLFDVRTDVPPGVTDSPLDSALADQINNAVQTEPDPISILNQNQDFLNLPQAKRAEIEKAIRKSQEEAQKTREQRRQLQEIIAPPADLEPRQAPIQSPPQFSPLQLELQQNTLAR